MIEQAMKEAFERRDDLYGIGVLNITDLFWVIEKQGVSLAWAPQVHADPYVLDFGLAVWTWPVPPLLFGVECDGHEYHDVDKERAKRDRQKDRYLAASGIQVLRFSGSEIWNDADACVGEIIEIAERRSKAIEKPIMEYVWDCREECFDDPSFWKEQVETKRKRENHND